MSGYKVGVGLSRKTDSAAAAKEAAQAALAQAGLASGAWALCFFSPQHLQSAELLWAGIQRETGCRALCGCSTMGVIAEGEELEHRPGVAVMVGGENGIEPLSSLLSEDGGGLELFREVADSLGGNRLLIALPDSFSVDINQVRERLVTELPGMPIFGAGATDDGRVGLSLQMGPDAIRNRSIALLGLFGEFETAVGITQSCSAVGEPHFITAARDNIIIELDGKPALEAMINQGQELGLEDFQELANQVMLGFPLDAENPEFTGETCLVRPLSGLEQASRGLIVPFPIENQTSMVFMHRNPLMAEKDMERMVERAAQGLSGPPDFGVFFDCAGRGQRFYGRPGVDSTIIAGRFGEVPVIGMFGGYELATALGVPRIYTYTGVLLLVRSTT